VKYIGMSHFQQGRESALVHERQRRGCDWTIEAAQTTRISVLLDPSDWSRRCSAVFDQCNGAARQLQQTHIASAVDVHLAALPEGRCDHCDFHCHRRRGSYFTARRICTISSTSSKRRFGCMGKVTARIAKSCESGRFCGKRSR